MAFFQQYKYQTNTTEIEFMQGLIDLICGLGSGITCEDTDGNPTTAAAQFSDLTSAKTATFVFNFGNNTKLTIERAANNSSTTKYYNVNGTGIQFAWAARGVLDVTDDRAFSLATLKGEKVSGIWFGNYNAVGMTSMYRSFMRISANNDNYVGTVGGHNIFSATFNSNTAAVNYSAIIPYTCGAGQIDYINHIIFISGGIKQFDFDGFFSCSTVSQYSSISLPNGKNYFALAPNAMVEINEPENSETVGGQSDAINSVA